MQMYFWNKINTSGLAVPDQDMQIRAVYTFLAVILFVKQLSMQIKCALCQAHLFTS